MRILVVDDEPMVRQMLSSALARPGASVDSAESCEDALAMLNATTYDCITLDQRMAGMDGLTLLGIIKERFPSTKVIMITGDAADSEFCARALSLGAERVMGKPLKINDLRKSVFDDTTNIRQSNQLSSNA